MATRITHFPLYTEVSPFRVIVIGTAHIWRTAFAAGLWDLNCEKWIFRDGKHIYIRLVEHAEQLTAEKLLDTLEGAMKKRAKSWETESRREQMRSVEHISQAMEPGWQRALSRKPLRHRHRGDH